MLRNTPYPEACRQVLRMKRGTAAQFAALAWTIAGCQTIASPALPQHSTTRSRTPSTSVPACMYSRVCSSSAARTASASASALCCGPALSRANHGWAAANLAFSGFCFRDRAASSPRPRKNLSTSRCEPSTSCPRARANTCS